MKKILFVFLASLFFALGANAVFERVNTYNDDFADVKNTSWYAENVKTAYELGFMNGKSKTAFDPDGKVTVAEAVAVASRIHAQNSGADVESYTRNVNEIRFDFDSMENLSFNNGAGEVKDGVLIFTSKQKNDGKYDPGIYLDKMLFDARVYNKLVVRMKREIPDKKEVENDRKEALEVFFLSGDNVLMSQERRVIKKVSVSELDEWQEYEIDLSENELWNDKIRRIRFDPTNNEGTYYIDYIYITRGRVTKGKWYHEYVDYAVGNGIMADGAFLEADYAKNISRSELCSLLAASLPEEQFGSINDITAIPDVDKNNKYADVLLMLYRAGVVLGDDKGNFNPDSEIRRSEMAAIISRMVLPEKRIKGNVVAGQDVSGGVHDYEFNSEDEIIGFEFDAESATIKNGALVLRAKENPKGTPKFDPKIIDRNVDIDADRYPVMRIRMKADFVGVPEDTRCDIFFMHEDDVKFNEKDAYHPDLFETSYVDASGWYVLELNMMKANNWKGKIKAFRFDPSNNDGTYIIDYIRFVRSDAREVITEEALQTEYTSRRIFPDETYENGFTVYKAGNRLSGIREDGVDGVWNYNDSEESPVWDIGPWWTDYNFFENRDTTTGKYILADKQGVKSMKYDPQEKSLTFKLNADKLYDGKPHNPGELWGHLIIIHDPYKDDYSLVPEERKPYLELSADKVYAEMDIKLVSCKDSENREGQLLSNFLVNYYFAHKEVPGIHTYFGVRTVGFDNDSAAQFSWRKDSHSLMKIYRIPMGELYGGMENSLWREDGNLVTGEWKHIKIDLTPHIENMIRLCNEENTYGRPVTVEDFWISGVNAGYEIRGNFSMEVEMKNFNLVCYDKK